MVEANVTDIVVRGLTPGVKYEFTIAAVNDIGTGPESNPVMALSATASNKLYST